jgi:hypothetical protein
MAFLSDDLRTSAVFTNEGREVMWPLDEAEAVVNALADHGTVVLGLDLRSDGEGFTPEGLATEVPLSAFRPEPSSENGVEAARRDATEALRRSELKDLSGYKWVLVTW